MRAPPSSPRRALPAASSLHPSHHLVIPAPRIVCAGERRGSIQANNKQRTFGAIFERCLRASQMLGWVPACRAFRTIAFRDAGMT
jgi:hypothetical protein